MKNLLLAAACCATLLAACGPSSSKSSSSSCSPACGAGQVCKSKTCIPATNGCLANADCTANPARKLCDPSSHTCVTCVSTSDCPSGQLCDAKAHNCVVPACSGDPDCANVPGATHCDTSTGQCAECVSSAQCPNGEVCSADKCIAPKSCTGDTDCTGTPTPKCDTSSGFCVACLASTDCPNGGVCDASHSCVPPPPCTTPADCASDPTHSICLGGKCMPCYATGATCPNSLACDAVTGVCTACVTNADCKDGAKPQCNVNASDETQNACGPCTSDAGCQNGFHCDTVSTSTTAGQCFQCLDNTQCSGTTLFCSPNRTCVECLQKTDCKDPAKPFCTPAYTCGACVTDNDCGPPTPHCDANNGYVCEQCVDSTQCMAQAPVCDTATDHTCVVCVSNTDCSGFTDLCDTATRSACYECLQDSDCFYGGTCDGTTHTCQNPVTCTADAQCSTFKCAAGACVECKADSDCVTGQTCSSTTHTCQNPASCTQSSDCVSGYVCNGGTCQSAACVDDGHEPNDTWGQAVQLTPGTPLAGLTLCPNNADWFTFTADYHTQGAHVAVTTPTSVDVYLAWYDSTQTLQVVRGVRHGGDIVVATGALTQAQMNRYFVAIFGETSASYSIDVETPPASCTDSGEPNDTATAAAGLAVNGLTGPLSACGDDDWYTVGVPAGQAFLPVLNVTTGSGATAQLFASTDLVNPAATLAAAATDSAAAMTGFDTLEGAAPTAVGGSDATWYLRVQGGTGQAYYANPRVGTDRSSCAAPQVIAIDSTTHVGSAAFDTFTSGNTTAGTCASAGPENVFKVTAPQGATVLATAALDSASSKAAVSIFIRGGACATGTEVGACTAAASGAASTGASNVAAGDYYVFVANANAGEHATGTLNVFVGQPPANDTCATAQALTLDVTGSASVSGYTTAAKSDYTSSTCGGSGPDVFYTVTIPAAVSTERYAATVTGSGGFTLPVVDLLTGCTASTEVTCGPPQRTTRAYFPSKPADTAFTVVVDGYSGSSGNYDLSIKKLLQQPGDVCATALPIAVGQTVTGDTTDVLPDYDPGSNGCTQFEEQGPELVYALPLNAGQGATVTVQPSSTAFDVGLYAVTDCTQLSTCVAGADVGYAGDPETITIPAPAAATTYYIMVDGYDNGGPFSLAVQ